MAVTTTGTQKQEEQKQQQVQQYQTALQQAQQQGAQTNNNQTKLAAAPVMQVGGKTYTSRFGDALDNILQQIQTKQDFKYDFNGDELFKYYADLYSKEGKKASMDAIGQASALTGGYGNSWAEQVGQQTYDDYLTKLYEKGDQFRDRAYQKYQDERSELYNQYGTLANQENAEYSRWFDTATNEQKYAAEYCMQILANGNMPSDEMLAAAGISKGDAESMRAQAVEVVSGGGGGGGGTNNLYVDKNGIYYTKDKSGKTSLVNTSKLPASTKVTKTNDSAGLSTLMTFAGATAGTAAKLNKKK